MSDAIVPLQLDVPQGELDDLRRRLAQTRWPEKEPVADWSQGAPLEKVRALCDHWQRDYDWRRCERLLNGFGQHRTTLDGLDIQFLHVRSRHAEAMPMIMTHGWPGSVVEFFKVIGPLTDPLAHGGSARDAFHLVLPSLPGFGFSDKPEAAGWGSLELPAHGSCSWNGWATASVSLRRAAIGEPPSRARSARCAHRAASASI